MHPDDKRRLVERALRASKKHLTFEETKLRKEEARRRRAERSPRAPRERVDLADELEEEHDERAERVGRRRRARSASPRPPALEPEHGEGRTSCRGAAASGPSATSSQGEELETGRVVGLGRTRATLRCGAERLEAAFAPELELAVGDRVRFARRAGGIVLARSVLPRTSWLARPDPGGAGRLVLAANVELVCAVVAARSPRWKPGFVDRVWLAAEEGGARTLVVVNKLDLLAPEEHAELEHELAPFLALGLAVARVSAASGEGLEQLARMIAGRVCVLVGPSGAGKSSLANALDPARGRATAPVRDSDGKGRHTTSASEWVELGGGTVLVDTPGVRQFALGGLDARTLAASFCELAEPARRCRFRDCSHLVEPGCAVQVELAARTIDRHRFESYRRMRSELEEG